jgi:TRAP-type uncharacterized transport system fused permease subunit
MIGLGLPTTAAYVLAAAVLAPPLISLGIQPLVAHLFVFYYAALSPITPPVCAAVFLSAGLAGANWFKSSILSCMIVLPIFVIPYAFAYNQILLLNFADYGVFEIALAFVTAILGVTSIAMGVAGYNQKLLSTLLRIAAVVGGVLMTVPMITPSLVGVAIFAVVYSLTRSGPARVNPV